MMFVEKIEERKIYINIQIIIQRKEKLYLNKNPEIA